MAAESNPKKSTLQQLAPFMGMGIQLAAAMTVFGALGWWLDTRLETAPWLLLVGVMTGAVGGLVSVIRTALRSNRKEGDGTSPT